MELIAKLEKLVAGWLKQAPHLPNSATKWLGDNVWWMAVIGLVVGALAALIVLTGVFTTAAFLGSVGATYYVVQPTAWTVMSALVHLALLVVSVILMGIAIKPLQAKQKKGWTLLFATLIVSAVSVLLDAVLSLNVFTFITSLLFGAIGLAVGAYFLFEIRGQFMQVEKSKGVKTAKKSA